LKEDSKTLAVHITAGLAAALTVPYALCFVRERGTRVQRVVFGSESYFINLGASLHA